MEQHFMQKEQAMRRSGQRGDRQERSTGEAGDQSGVRIQQTHMQPHNMPGAVLSVHSSEHNSQRPCPPGGYFSDVTSSETRLQQSCQ